jgi:hypothetical protein
VKVKDRSFDTNDVVEAEFQAVLNALADHDFQDAFIIYRSTRKNA